MRSLLFARLRRAATACGIGLIFAPAALAQVQAPKIEFDEAIRRALENNPTVAEAAKNIQRAEALLQHSRALTLPLVSVGLTNITLDSERGFSGSVTQPQNQFSFTASASVPILSLASWATVDQARDQIEVANRSTADVRQSIAVAAAQAYLRVITLRRQVEVDERALDTARAHLDYAQKRFEGGAGSRLNQLRAAQEAASDQARLEATRLALRSAQEALGVVIAANGPVDAGNEPNFDTTVPSNEAEWMATRTDLQFQASVQRAAERVVRDSWKDHVPTAAVSFDPVFLTPAGLFQPSRTWRLAINMTYAVFEGGERQANARVREVSRDQANLAFVGLQIQARSDVRLAEESVQALERAFASAREATEHALEVLKITTAAYEVGATTNLEVIDAQRSARDADTRSTLAEDAVRRAKLDLLVALGRFPK